MQPHLPFASLPPPSSSNPISFPADPLERPLLGLMAARLLFGTLLMGSAVIYQWGRAEQAFHPTDSFVFWLVGSTYLLSLFYCLLFPRLRHLAPLAWFQLTGDLGLVSLLVLATGVQDSLFLFSYLLVIIAAGILLYRKGALLFAIVSFVSLSGLLVGSRYQIFQSLPFVRPPVPLERSDFAYILLVFSPAFVLVALLASHLAEQLRSTDRLIQEKQTRLELLHSRHADLETLHHDIVQSLSSGLLTLDLDGHVVFWNPQALEILGRPQDDLLTSLSILSIFPDLPLKSLQSTEQSATQRLELSILGTDQSRRIIVLSWSRLRNRKGLEMGYLALLENVTRVKEIESTARRSEKLAAIGQLAAGLAHEIRNPLASLSGSIQMLRDELSLQADQMVLMDIVLRETERLNRLLTDFLLFARPKALQRSSRLLRPLFEETLALLSQDERFSRIRLETQIPSDTRIDADPQMFHQVCWNLLINAAQAIGENHGLISISAEDSPHGVRLTFTDSGPGISPEVKDKLFDPFVSTKEGGTGLGLSVVQRILAEHQGQISAESQPGQTSFRLFFPRSLSSAL